MQKVLLSAFVCDPTKGSEPGNGWNWASGLTQKGFEVHCFTRVVNKKTLEQCNTYQNLHFHYIALPFGLEKLYTASQPTMYLYYILWQWFAYKKASSLHEKFNFNIAHHVTWGSLQMGSFLYKLNLPFVFGPAGGGQRAPVNFKKYFGSNWKAELRREKLTRLFLKFNPAFKQMIRKANMVIVSNHETKEMAISEGAGNVFFGLDAALPVNFFPASFTGKIPEKGRLKLLWIGRLMPRKGILLVLDVMRALKCNTSITLTVVGDGEEKEHFLNRIKEYQLEDTVFWKGRVSFEEVKTYYEVHDVFFFTSLRDSGGVQLVEAMAYGLPVVTIDLHGQGIMVNNDRGVVCNCSTPEIAIKELTDAINYLFSNPSVLTEKSIAAYKYAIKQMWPDKIDVIVEKCYPISVGI